MPIEILPEGHPDWIEFSSKPDILFLGIDPYWSVKAGGNPANAILYRGGAGFFDRSTDGGQTWSSIVPSTDPPWLTTNDVIAPYEPVPRPDVTPPTAFNLIYKAYSGNFANTGEHLVLCNYEAAGGNALGDTSISYVLYTFDDWVSHDWTEVITDMSWNNSAVTTSSWVELYDGGSNPSSLCMVKISDTVYGAFWSEVGGTIRAYKLTLSGGVFTASTATSRSGYFSSYPQVYSGKVYFGAINYYADDGLIRKYRGEIDIWSFGSSTPTQETRKTGPELPDLNLQYGRGAGGSWTVTGAGRLAFVYTNQDSITTPYSTGPRKWWWFYYDIVLDSWSTEYLFHDGVANDPVPANMSLTAECIDGSNKMIVSMLHNNTWTNRLIVDQIGRVFIMDIGTWTQIDPVTYLSVSASSSRYYLNNWSSKLMSNDRFAVMLSYSPSGTAYAYPRMFTYTVSPESVTEIQYGGPDTFDTGDGVTAIGELSIPMVRDDPAGDYAASYNQLFWSEATTPPLFQHKFQEYSDSMEGVRVGLNTASQFSTYGGIRERYDGTWHVEVAVHTVVAHGGHDIWSRYPYGIAATLNGEHVYISFGQYSAGPSNMEQSVDRIYREPDARSGVYDYVYPADDWFWAGWDSGFTKAEMDALDTYIIPAQWNKYADGIIMFGRLEGVSDPVDPRQVWAYSSASGGDYYLDESNMSARAVIMVGGLMYAMVQQGGTAVLWQEVVPTEYLASLSISLLSDVGINCMTADSVGTIAIAHKDADLIMVAITESPYSTWSNATLSHKNDRGVTGIIVMG